MKMGYRWASVFLACCGLMIADNVAASETEIVAKILGMQTPIIIKDVSLRKGGRHLMEGVVRLPNFDKNLDKYMKKKGELLPKEWQVDAYWRGGTKTQAKNRRLDGQTKMRLGLLRLFSYNTSVFYSLAPPVFRAEGQGAKKFFLRLKINNIGGIPGFIERLSGVGKPRYVGGFKLPDFDYDGGRFKWCALASPRYQFSYHKDGEDLLMNFKINARLAEKNCRKK